METSERDILPPGGGGVYSMKERGLGMRKKRQRQRPCTDEDDDDDAEKKERGAQGATSAAVARIGIAGQ